MCTQGADHQGVAEAQLLPHVPEVAAEFPTYGTLSTPGGHPQFLAMGPSKHSSLPLQGEPGSTWGSPDYARPTQDCSHLTNSKSTD